MASMIVVV